MRRWFGRRVASKAQDHFSTQEAVACQVEVGIDRAATTEPEGSPGFDGRDVRKSYLARGAFPGSRTS
jgi:hypothetical protein